MDWKGHVIFGAVLALLLFYFVLGVQDFASLASLFFLAAISALIPDLDHELSTGRKLADSVALLFAMVFAFFTNSIVAFFALVGLYFILYKLLKPKHRGITHTLFAVAVFTLLLYALTQNSNFALAGLIGYSSHLIGDKTLKLI